MTWDTLLLARIAGSVGGSLIALAIVEPRSWKGLFERLFVSLVCGMVFAEIGGEYLGWVMTFPQRMMAAACVCSMCGWWIMHGIIRAAQAGWIPGIKKTEEQE